MVKPSLYELHPDRKLTVLGQKRGRLIANEELSSVESSELQLSDDSSSLHSSDYSSSKSCDLNDLGDFETLESSTLVKSTTTTDDVLHRPPTVDVETGSASSGSPWADGTESSTGSPASGSLEKEANFVKARSRLLASMASSAGQHPSKPIDVTGAPLFAFKSSLLQPKSKGRASRKATTTTRILGVSRDREKPHRNGAVQKGSVPAMVPVCYSKDDDVSTIGGTFPAYKTMSYHHRHPGYNRKVRENEDDNSDIERRLWEIDFDQEKSAGDCLKNRTDLELFLICVIVAALLTLIVLMAMVLKQG